ncbi:MAG: sulfatase-like hydrolase/transferase [Alphaproteobacteria bacterium]|nr:sulfatase-like hydrolase/transferase [Alphaproteobacteria bacterium]
MSNLIFASFYIFLIGFLPLFYTFFKSIKQADLKNKLFYKLFLKDVMRTFPICFLMIIPLFLFPSFIKGYLLLLHFIFIPLMLLEIGHIYFFKTRVGLNTFFTLFVSNMKETKEFLTQNIPALIFCLAGICLILPIFFIVSLSVPTLNWNERAIGSLICLILGIPFIRNLFKKGFKFKDGYVLNPYSNVIYHFFLYKKTYAELKEALAKNKAEPFQNILSDAKEDDPETYVVIIGESANRAHLSLYGYSRQTTPFSDARKKDLFVFENVKSPFAQTMPVLERVLTFAEEGKMNFLTEKGTIVNYFKQAGFKTYWLSNQYALSDTLITAISSHADWEKSYNFSGMKRFEKTGFDGDMLPDIERILNDKSSHKKVVFVHLIGSHSAYTNRYPSDWAHFKDYLKNKNLTAQGHQLLNAYDDSIRYTDYVVNEIIQMTQKQEEVSFCLYFSDHGEDIYDTSETKILGHSELANEPMTAIPFVLWVSDKYRDMRKKVVYNLYQNQKKEYNTEHVIHTIIRLAGLENQDVEKEKSLAD